MSVEPQEHKPLHVRLQEESHSAKKTMLQKILKQDDLNDLYRGVFETDEGQRLLSHLVESYIGHVPKHDATPNEIMFMHGQNYIVHDILNRVRRK